MKYKVNIHYILKIFISISYLSLCNISVASENNNAVELNISAIDWCPQICLSNKQPGYVVEIINQIFTGKTYQPKINYFPWSRAINNVTFGKSHALLSPAKKEAPHLTYPSMEIGYQKMCFFVDKNSQWKYEGFQSLKGLFIGIAKDTSIEELNQYMHQHPEQFQFQPYHERFVKQNALKLLKRRIDTFIFTLNTTIHTLKNENLHGQIKNAGCVSRAPIYIAFTPVEKEQQFIEKVKKHFENKMRELTENGTIAKILEAYQIK